MKKNLFLTALVALLSGLASAQTVSVTGSPFEVKTSSRYDTVNIPLKLDNITLNQIIFVGNTPYSVRNGGSAEKDFVAGLNFLKVDNPAHLQLSVDTKLLNAQGSYEVNILYNIKDKPSGYLTFTLTRAAATLTANKIEVRKDGSTIWHNQLLLTETGNKGAVTNLVLVSPYLPGEKTGNLITFSKRPVTIERGKFAKVDYSVSDIAFKDLPLGETVSEFQLNADELSTPLKVQVDIWKKRDKWLIVLIVFVGLLLGAFVRHFLKDRRDVEQARLNALRLIQDMKAFTKDIQDLDFQREVNSVIEELLRTVNISSKNIFDGYTAAVNAAITKAQGDYGAKKIEFGARFDKTRLDYDGARSDLFAGNVDPVIASWLMESKLMLEKTGERLMSADPKTASEFLTQTADLLKIAANNYLAYVQSFLILLVANDGIIPTDAAIRVNNNLQDKPTGLKIKLDTAASLITDRHALLLALNEIQMETRQIVAIINVAVKEHFEAQNATAAASTAFLDAYDKWFATLSAMVANEKRFSSAIFYRDNKLLAALLVAWNDAVGGAAPDRAPGAGAPIIARDINSLFSIHLENVAEPGDIETISLSDITGNYNAISTRFFLLTLLQTGILTLLIGLGAYLTYGPKFIGTADELITIFFIAFSMDITIDSVSQLKGKTTG